MTGRAIVIGSGLIGTACADQLSSTGWSVTMVDRGELGRGASHANCGLVVPSHVLPLAEPGAVRHALADLFSGSSRFLIKPRFDPALWGWLVRFARRCNETDMKTAAKGIQALLASSRGLYPELVARLPLDCEWRADGVLYVFRSAESFDGYAELDRLLRTEFGVGATRYGPDELGRLEPALKLGLAGGWLYPDDAHLRPDRLLASWYELLVKRGVELRPRCEALGFTTTTGRASAVRTTTGDLAADAFVVATGAWTRSFAGALGQRVPIEPGKGYSLTMARPAVCPARPLLFPADSVVATPLESGYRLGSTMEFAGFDSTVPPARLEYLKQVAERYLREPYTDRVEERWFGWRPMTYDGLPLIGRTEALPNVVLAAGHNMLGLSMAPATGRLVAEILNEIPPHLDPSPYRPDRF